VKKLFLLFISILSLSFVSAEELITLDPLGDDLSTLFTSIGRDVVPILQQNSVSGDTYGEAEIDDVFLPFYLNLPTIGLSTSNGIATVLTDERAVWKFTLGLPDLIKGALTGDDVTKIFDLTQRVAALPTVKLGMGFKLPAGFELHLSGIYLPAIDYSAVTKELANLNLDITDIGVKIRKTIFTDKGLRPAFSIGARYFYSTFNVGYNITSIADLLGNKIEAAGFGELDLSGKFTLGTMVQSYGLDFHLSKRLLLFTPFIKLSPTVYFASINTNANFAANLYSAGTTDVLTKANLVIDAPATGTGLALLASTGVEVRLIFLTIHLGVTANLQNPVFTLGNVIEGDFTETALDKLSLDIALRLNL